MSNLKDLKSIVIKQGDSFLSNLGNFTQDGVAVDITGMTFVSEVRDLTGDTVVATIVINIIDAVAGTISIPAVDTSTWPEGRLLWDIKTTRGGQVVHTETILINVVKSVTA